MVEGAKDIVVNQMHARIPNSSVRRNQWLNLCIDMQSFMNECFGKQAHTPTGSVNGNSSVSSQGAAGGGGAMYPVMGTIPQNIYKCLEHI